jgi:hypothetical protein
MTSIEAVKERYRIKAEKNGTNDNITTDNYRFCLNFNESQNKFLTLALQNRGVDDIRYIQKFLILDKNIPPKSTSENKVNFSLPEDYFDLSSARAKAQSNGCQDLIELVEIQTENINEIMFNEYLKPSFNWREAPYTVNSDNLSVYVDDFTIDALLLNYYRYPNQIKLQDTEDPESAFADIEVEWDDKSLDDIISIMVANLDMNENNPRFQINTLRTQK